MMSVQAIESAVAVAPEKLTGEAAGSRRPELLAPAGDWECAKAAVENGADAIYFGLERFNARMRAHNFTVADLPRLMEFLHRRGVRGYVTFNTLVFQNEMADAREYLTSIIAAGVDAAIVQDVGICRLIRALSPDFPIHASTQMTVTSAEGVAFARELGCDLVVLARECSVTEIEKIQAASANPSTAVPSMPLEVFVHGALCVAYSGQCLTSESLGGRSANRGECAQACRMPYALISDGKQVELGDRRYLLSPQDLSGLEVLPELMRVGVSSLKIEGRLKTPEYVANITRVYRQAIDRIVAATQPPSGHETGEGGERDLRKVAAQLTADSRYNLEMGFSRGLSTGWFQGIDNQKLVHARFGKKRGVLLGEVLSVGRDGVTLELQAPLKPGDGVVFDAGRPDRPEQGGRVYGVQESGGRASVYFGIGDLDFEQVRAGDLLWKTSDPVLERELRATFEGEAPKHRRPISMEVHGAVGLAMTLIARDEFGHIGQAASTILLAAAEKQPLSEVRLRDQLGRLGGTPYLLGELRNRLEGAVMLPVSELNRLRRDLVAQLDAQRAQPKRWRVNAEPSSVSISLAGGQEPEPADPARATAPELIVLVRSMVQLETVLGAGVGTIYCEFEDPKKYRVAVQRFREWVAAHPGANGPAPRIFVAPPRIFKMGEEWIIKQVRSSEPDGYLIRNYDHLKAFAGERAVGDFSLNVANALTADHFKNRHGLERVTASYDLNYAQVEALLEGAPPEWFEIVLHQHMPMFHMEHCVFCAFLSKGKDYRDCGRPCDTRDVKVRDRVGAEHPLRADAGCRNTVFNSLAQTGAEHASRFLALGARKFRVELLNESSTESARIVEHYQRLLRGEITGAELWRELKLRNQLGVTRGPMEAPTAV